jgi:tetratricopeptide (TPR) repeat protein
VFEAVADHYYAFGTRQSIERSVKEWRNAYDLGGPGRERVSGKLAAHYLKEGRDFLAEAEEKGKGETELPSALASFQQALRFDRTSEVAVDLIQETNKRKKERDEHRSMIVNIIAQAETAREDAENNGTGGNFGLAIKGYQQVMSLLQGVDDEFTDQFDLAEEMKRNITQSISSTIGDVQEQASAAIEQGERLEETHKYEEAIREYERVPVIVTVIPDDHTASAKQGKLDAIALAEAKIAKARSAKTAYEQSMQNAGGRPAAPGAAAPAPRAGGRDRDRE